MKQRYWSPAEAIEAYSIPEPNTGCFIWLNALDSGGYGILNSKGKVWKAHRMAWIIARGPIPDGLCVCHHCDNRLCVNVDHLFLGTYRDNIHDMQRKGRNRQPRGIYHNKAKLTPDDVRAIRASPLNGPALAKVYNVDRSTINSIRKKEAWSHVL